VFVRSSAGGGSFLLVAFARLRKTSSGVPGVAEMAAAARAGKPAVKVRGGNDGS